MSPIPESLAALAEALSPLSHSLAAGLLVRPFPEAGSAPADLDSLKKLCADAAAMLDECMPAMRQAMAALENANLDETEELADELAAPALDLVDLARTIWTSPFPPESESLRPLLATLVEAPPVALLQWMLEIMHCAIDPWSVAENPEAPAIDFSLHIPDAPLCAALKEWNNKNPGLLPQALLIEADKR